MDEYTKEQLLQIIEDLKAQNLELNENLSLVTLMAYQLQQELKKERESKQSYH